MSTLTAGRDSSEVVEVPINDPGTLALLQYVEEQPVLLRRNSRDAAILISPSEYERRQAGEIIDFDAACQFLSQKVQRRGLTEEKLEQILNDIHDEDRP
jgi:hypothetical protein